MASPESRQDNKPAGQLRKPDWFVPGGKLQDITEDWGNRRTLTRPPRVALEDLQPSRTGNETTLYEVD